MEIMAGDFVTVAGDFVIMAGDFVLGIFYTIIKPKAAMPTTA